MKHAYVRTNSKSPSCCDGALAAARRLLDNGAGVDVYGYYGAVSIHDSDDEVASTPLHFACSCVSGNEAVVRLLLDRGAAVDVCSQYTKREYAI